MKSYIRTIIVLVLFGLLMASASQAQETPGETAKNLPPAAALPLSSKETVPPPPSPSQSGAASVTPIAGEADFATGVELGDDPLRRAYTYVNVAPSAAGRSSSSSRKVLVIPNAEVKTEDLVAITQDLQVMSHIFHKIFTGPQLVEGLFMKYGDVFGRGSRATEAVYLQGYGALFLMEVNIPLSSPPRAKETEKEESTQKADSVWNQAKQEIFHPSPYNKTRATVSTERYDENKVEELKSRLIKALKHAANMRNLEPNESIILTVIGKGSSYRVGVGSGVGGYGGGGYGVGSGVGGYGGAGYDVVYGSSVENGASNRRSRSRYSATRSVPGGTGISAPTVLTIRAKKSDVDAFAKGELDYDKFREKVQILTYLSLDQQVGRGYRLFRYSKPPEPPIESLLPNSTNNKDNRF